MGCLDEQRLVQRALGPLRRASKTQLVAVQRSLSLRACRLVWLLRQILCQEVMRWWMARAVQLASGTKVRPAAGPTGKVCGAEEGY